MVLFELFPGNSSKHRPSDGPENEPIEGESFQYAARSAAPQQIISSEYFEVSLKSTEFYMKHFLLHLHFLFIYWKNFHFDLSHN